MFGNHYEHYTFLSFLYLSLQSFFVFLIPFLYFLWKVKRLTDRQEISRWSGQEMRKNAWILSRQSLLLIAQTPAFPAEWRMFIRQNFMGNIWWVTDHAFTAFWLQYYQHLNMCSSIFVLHFFIFCHTIKSSHQHFVSRGVVSQLSFSSIERELA